ncbi:MAG: hypothetical protein ACK4RK_03350 [Gemmataceae bacterium]
MNPRWTLLMVTMLTSLLAARPACAQSPTGESGPAALTPLLAGGTPDALAGSLRGLLIHAIPSPLYQDAPGWGEQKYVARGVEWHGKGLKVKPEIQKAHKNHGVWRKIIVYPVELPRTLVVDIRDVHHHEPGRTTFLLFIAFDAWMNYDQQNWNKGHRLYSGSVRLRFRVQLAMRCELTTRVEPNNTFFPDIVFRVRVLQAHTDYDNFVVEHVFGIGGRGAEVIGNTAKGIVHQIKPSLERNMLAKANAAIVQAADTKEIRIGLMDWLKSAGEWPVGK